MWCHHCYIYILYVLSWDNNIMHAEQSYLSGFLDSGHTRNSSRDSSNGWLWLSFTPSLRLRCCPRIFTALTGRKTDRTLTDLCTLNTPVTSVLNAWDISEHSCMAKKLNLFHPFDTPTVNRKRGTRRVCKHVPWSFTFVRWFRLQILIYISLKRNVIHNKIFIYLVLHGLHRTKNTLQQENGCRYFEIYH